MLNSNISIFLILFLSLVGITIIGIIVYYIYYRISINKSLHSDKPKKRVPPKNIIIIALASLFTIAVVCTIGFTILASVSTGSSSQQIISDSTEYGAIFDPLFDDAEFAQKYNYELTTWQENDFEVCVLTGGESGLMPTFLIRVRYMDDLPSLVEGEYLDYSFGFYYRDAGSGREFTGMKTIGAYSTRYIMSDIIDKLDIKIMAWLKVSTDKTGEPFAEIQYEFTIERNETSIERK